MCNYFGIEGVVKQNKGKAGYGELPDGSYRTRARAAWQLDADGAPVRQTQVRTRCTVGGRPADAASAAA